MKLVLGLTCPVGKCIGHHPKSGLIAYTASNVIVLYDTINIRQIRYLSEGKNPIETLSFSHDGKMIVTGESGHMPPVRVWDVQLGTCLASLFGHEYGVSCTAFSPKGNLIVSVGRVHDRSIFIWSWPQKEQIASNRFSDDITNVCFSPDNLFFVTCGVHHVKFWYPQRTESIKISKKKDYLNSALYGRPALLGALKTEIFVDVRCGTKRSDGFVYIATSAGHVSQILTVMTLPEKGNRPHQLVELEESYSEFENARARELIFSIHLCFDYVHQILTVLSSDGKLSTWDVRDLQQIEQTHYFSSHYGGISCSDILQGEGDLNRKREGDMNRKREGDMNRKRETIVTVSPGDSTIRLWHLDVAKTASCNGVVILLADLKSALTPISDCSNHDSLSGSSCEGQGVHRDVLTATKACSEYLVTGDFEGNVVAYSTIDRLEIVAAIKYHYRPVTCLEILKSRNLLLSGGRDRQIIVYDMANAFKVINVMQIQSGSVTILRLYQTETRLMLVSGGRDRSLVLSDCAYADIPSFSVRYNRLLQSSAVDCVFNDHEMSLGIGMLNGEISIFCLKTLNLLRSFPSSDLNARIEKLAFHSKYNLILAACSNKCINIISYYDGTILSTSNSHAATTSGLHCCIENHCVISTSSDGCIFIMGFSVKDNKYRNSLKKRNIYQTM